jgi:hypothetical protein
MTMSGSDHPHSTLSSIVWTCHRFRKDLAGMHERDPLRVYLEARLDGLEETIACEAIELSRTAERLFETRQTDKTRRLAAIDQYHKRERAREREEARRNAPDPEPELERQRRLEAAREDGLLARERETAARAAQAAQQADMLARAAVQRRAERERRKALELQQVRGRLKRLRPPQ